MNRGSDCQSGRLAAVRAGFNEAPIHESGKFGCFAARTIGRISLQ